MKQNGTTVSREEGEKIKKSLNIMGNTIESNLVEG